MTTPARTERLTFRCWTPADLVRATSLWCDPEVMRFMGGPYTREEVAARLAREIANLEERGIQYWPLFSGDEFIGCCGLKPNPDDASQLELGFHLLPAYWGRGFGAESARAVIAYAFDLVGADAIYAGHHPHNEASRALLTRLGFEQIGAHLFPRTGLDHPWYRLTRSRTFAASPAASSG
ncbi:MAG TPA: GNAT family N-acetyltransferase [Thermoanaerobaculia bacterium]|nr:GNAT family N-acetyltransferase [Thermoanaerobaculia bacterium]